MINFTEDPFGNIVSTSGALTTPFGFTGVYTDAESGLLAATHRYYDPKTSTWLTVDPLVAATLQPYAYVHGNPLNGVDPQGLKEINTIPTAAHYTGPTAYCWKAESSGYNDYIVMNPNGESDVKRCETAYPGQGMTADSAISTFGGTPTGQTCSFDPGTGMSHCTTPPSDLENKITTTCYLAIPDLVLALFDAPASVSITWASIEGGIDAHEWFGHK